MRVLHHWIILCVTSALIFRRCHARANVTMHVGLTYDSSQNCDESPYKVRVCVGQQLDRCRLFGPQVFYVQAACAAYGPKEVIQFEVDKVEEPLKVDSRIETSDSEGAIRLPPITANLTFPYAIETKTIDLKLIVQFHFAYTCVANYFGELCDTFCSSSAKEYRCSLSGEKICNSGYIKDAETGGCINDLCGSMPDYCLNGGRCVNKVEGEESSARPVCICPLPRMGARCKTFHRVDTPPLTSLPSSSSSSPPPSSPPSSSSSTSSLSSPSSTPLWPPDAPLRSNETLPDQLVGIRQTGSSEHPGPYWELWKQVMIFTTLAVGLVVLALGICLFAGCYVIRMRNKTTLLRLHQQGRFGEMRFVDGGCLGTQEVSPIYLQRCSTLEYAPPTPQNTSAFQTFTMRRPTSYWAAPTDATDTQSMDQSFVFTNSSHPQPGGRPQTLNRAPRKKLTEYGIHTYTCGTLNPSPVVGEDEDEEESVIDPLPHVKPPEAYSFGHEPCVYLSELRNHLSDVNICVPPSNALLNNLRGFQTSAIMTSSRQPPGTKSPLVLDSNSCCGTAGVPVEMELHKNYFQRTPTTPPNEFTDLIMK